MMHDGILKGPRGLWSLHNGEEQSHDYSAERLPTLRQNLSPRSAGTEVGLLPVIREKQL